MSPETVTVAVEPVILPGLTVQLPAGRPLRTTLPVDTEHVGCVMAPMVGASGRGFTVTVVAADCAL